MTQRQLERLPEAMRCKNGHVARLMEDRRCRSSDGGVFVECTCTQTARHDDREAAERDWRRLQGIRTRRPAPAPTNVLQLGLRLTGGNRG